MKRSTAAVWTTDTHILLTSAFCNGGSPRQPAAPVCGVADLPSANQIIHRSTTGEELLALAEREFVNRVQNPYVVAIEVHRTPSDGVVRSVVVAVIVIGMRVGVMGQEL